MKIDHVTLMVSSLERSMPYYEPGTSPYERYGAGMNHLGFGASSPEQVQEIREAMREAGFDVPDMQKLRGATALFMKDPDGIRFEVTYYPPGATVVD